MGVVWFQSVGTSSTMGPYLEGSRFDFVPVVSITWTHGDGTNLSASLGVLSDGMCVYMVQQGHHAFWVVLEVFEGDGVFSWPR